MALPTPYPLGTRFGVPGKWWIAKKHTGADFLCPTGSTIKAAAAGTVIFAGRGGWGAAYGIHVIVESRVHGKLYQAIYAHLQSESVSVGQSVAAGATLGRSNATGNVTGPHLHFEVREKPFGYWDFVDPKVLLSLTSAPAVPELPSSKFHEAKNTYVVTTTALPLTVRRTPGGLPVGALAKGKTFTSRGWQVVNGSLWVQRDDGTWLSGTYLDLVPKSMLPVWFGRVISRNLGLMNDTGAAKARKAGHLEALADDLVELKPFAAAVQELLGEFRDRFDALMKARGYTRSGGSDGRCVYFRIGTKVLASGVWDMQPRFKGDDRQCAYVVLDHSAGAVLIDSGHMDHSDPTGNTQVAQARDVVAKANALLDGLKLPRHRVVHCWDTNSRNKVREAMKTLGYYDVIDGADRVDNATEGTHNGWNDAGTERLDGIWMQEERGCRWAGIRLRNDHLSDHRAVVAEPALITA